MKAYAAQMKRVLMSLGVAVLALIGLAAPLIQFSDDADPTVDPVTISDYRADYRVAHDGELTARESISTLFPPSRHGIFRFWDVTDAADPHVRYIPDAIAVTLDGHAVPVELSWEANRRFRVAKIGDPDSYLSPGTHVFVITYRVDGVLAPARGGTSGTDARFLWRVVPDGWRMPITRSETRIELPGKPLAAACRVDDGAPCTIAESGPRSRIVTTGALPPMTGVAFRADLPSAAPDRTATPWSQYLDAVLGRSLRTVTALVLASLVMLGAGVAWVLRSRESTPPQPVMVVPPADPLRPDSALGPVQTYFATHGDAATGPCGDVAVSRGPSPRPARPRR